MTKPKTPEEVVKIIEVLAPALAKDDITKEINDFASYLAEMEYLKVQRAFVEGRLKSLWDHAWYREGVQYVGSGIHTYAKATENLDKEHKELIQNS